MTNWKNKLLAFLHDPPHKPFRIAGHEDARGPLLRHLGLSEADIDQWEREHVTNNPDWQAAAADRFPFPRGEVLFVDWKAHGGLEFRHPLAGSRFEPIKQPRKRSAVGESWVEQAIHGIPIDETGWQAKFFRAWRLWPERCAREHHPILAYLVADTRIPDHTLWQHNALVSAIEAVGAKPTFLLFQIGPVQDFIAQARKMQDLWSGSYLLSFLISKALSTLALHFGPDTIVYPNLRGVPLLDWWWSKEEGLFPKDFFQLGQGRLHPNELLTPSLPNRFLALVPAGQEGRDIAIKLEQDVRQLWREIADAVHADICAKLQAQLRQDEFPGWDSRWKDQAARFPVVDWALHEWLPEAEAFQIVEAGTPPVAGGWNNHPLRHTAAWREMIPGPHREPWHGKRNDAFAWALHYAVTDWKFAACKSGRAFAPWPLLSPGTVSPPKDHLNGRDEVVGGARPLEFWTALRAAYGGAEGGDFRGSQLYGATSVIKRLWPAAFLRDNLRWSAWKPAFESVQDIALIARAIESEPGEELGKDDPKYFAVLTMDGDDMGQWVSGARTPMLKDVLAGKAWDYFQHGKDGQGGWKPTAAQIQSGLPAGAEAVQRPLSPGFHAALSEALSNFGLYCAGQVVEAFNGQLLYCGGDDVLAMLPATNALDCATALQCAFRGELPPSLPLQIRKKIEGLFEFYAEAPGFLRCRHSGKDESLRPNWPLMVPGPRATASVGIAVGHVRAPMQDTIQAARDAEAAAKQVPGKGAFCLSILKRSGESAAFAARFEAGVASVWAELEANPDTLSGRFPYRFLQNLSPLLARPGADSEERWEPRWTGELIRCIEAELRHVHYQQNESGEPSERKQAVARDKASHWMQQLAGDANKADDAEFQAALSPKDFAHFWMAWAFVRRLRERTKDDQ
ncbi:MAG: type III-B CRISPR-associated protein Cas10/Cmr2 [Limisphaerales bacterium]